MTLQYTDIFIFDNKQRVSVKLAYNKNGSEVLRKFGNGTEEQTLYDKAGRVIVKLQKSERNELLWAEGYVYGDDGKRSATVDNKGLVTLYEYNKKGQLEKVYYPYYQELINNLKKEAEENGLPTNIDVGENQYLTSELRGKIVPLLNAMQYGLAYSLPNMQSFIKESYTYDGNGNRIGKTTKYGTINYSYDKENCLISSGSRNQAFINYTYDNAGNLLTEESANKVTKYAYNAQNRLIYCEVLDKAEKTYAQTTYAYDAFGRRVLVQDKDEAALRSLYDGFTFDVIKQSPVMANGLFTDSAETGIRWSPTGKPTGDRYRYISDEESQDDNRYFYLAENTYKTVNTRYRGARATITVNGTITAQITGEGSQYFTTDLLGSVSSVTDNYGSQKASYTYDAFGSLIQGDLTGTTDFGYLGKQNDPTAALYNYGYRDYKPQQARFTTIDPIRDGTNWFAYCNGDPVNFVDLWGLEISDTKTDKDAIYDTNLPNFGEIGKKENQLLAEQEQLTEQNDHHLRNGLLEIGAGLTVWLITGIEVRNTMLKDPKSTTQVGYGGIIAGGVLISRGVVRATGSSETTIKEDFVSILESPLGSAVREFNDSNNNGKRRASGRTIDYSNKKSSKRKD